jgi:hypothetical protein
MIKIALPKYFGSYDLKNGDRLFLGLTNQRSGLCLIVKQSGSSFEIVSLKNNKYFGTVGGAIYCQPKRGWAPPTTWHGSSTMLSEISGEAQKNNLLKKYYAHINAEEARKILIQKESVPPEILKKFLPDLFTAIEPDKIGNFTIHFDNQNQKEKDAIESLVARTTKAFEGFGFQRFLYGDIYIVDKLKGRVIADYTATDDSIRLSKKAKKDDSDCRNLIHELGHRIYKKSGVDKKEIQNKYLEALKEFSLEIKPDTVLSDKKTGEKYIYLGKNFSGREITYKIVKISDVDLSENKFTGKIYRCSAFYFTNFEGDFKLETNWLPTAYAKTSQEEWFCEVLSFALTRKDAHFVEFVKKITL